MCIFWCLSREINNQSFEDWNKTLEEIKSLFFKTFYVLTVSYVSHLAISCSDFFVLFATSSLVFHFV